MSTRPALNPRGGPVGVASLLGLVWIMANPARAQETVPASDNPATGWQRYDWLAPSEDQKREAAAGESFQVTQGQNIADPFAVLTTGALWQEKTDAAYTRRLADMISLTCDTSTVSTDDSDADYLRTEEVALEAQAMDDVKLRFDLHDSINDEPVPSDSTSTSGYGFSAESHLPFNSVLTMGASYDRTGYDTSAAIITNAETYNAQVTQPLGKLPLSMVLKGNYQTISNPTGPVSSLPTLEQSLVWKPAQDTTVQMGLRQQHYQEYPGIDDQFNAALFADWSQKLIDTVTWHSYAEVLNSRSLVDQAPAGVIASGANGTPQATTPGSNLSASSALPVSLDDQTLTFSTGPSFQIEKDISASVEYSNRWDKNPAPGNVGQEQRVSVSLKGTF